MMRQFLLPLSQNEAIENKFNRHPLYPYLDFVCKPIAAESTRFAIKTGDLFYHCVFSLDTLKGSSPRELEMKCAQLWADMVEYMRDKSLSTEDAEIIHAISLVVYSVERCLLLSNNPEYTYPAGIIQSVIQRYDSVFVNTLRKGFNRAEQLTNKDRLSKWIGSYMESEQKLSDEIDCIIDAQYVIALPSKRGRKKKDLFLTYNGERDSKRTEQEKERLLGYLRAHKLSQVKLNSDQENTVMQIIVSFYLRWHEHGYVPKQPNGMAIARFIIDDCQLPCEVTEKAFANCIRTMINDCCIDKSHHAEIAYLFPRN